MDEGEGRTRSLTPAEYHRLTDGSQYWIEKCFLSIEDVRHEETQWLCDGQDNYEEQQNL